MTTPELDALTEQGFLNSVLAKLLHAAVRARLNLIVTGPSGSGRTSLLRALGCTVPGSERIATLEMVPQLHLSRSGRAVVELTGPTAVAMMPTVMSQNIHRLLVDDTADDTALPLIQEMHGGGSGSMGTVEAADPATGIERLTGWTAATFTSPAPAVRLVHTAVDLIVHLTRVNTPAGVRRFVSHLHEVDCQAAVGQTGVLRPLFTPVPGQPRAVFQNLPACIDRLERHGFDRAVLIDASRTWGPQ
ncbi:ATPase, T2SS/T4P/T4SS family [Streptomyces xanthochromogenes]|uniref:ATPase, T2SS/T4P/T4SS family n=1 Tax=Streptomyces xanthochromogenes TaxID=67384 RepID=UPI00342D54FB